MMADPAGPRLPSPVAMSAGVRVALAGCLLAGLWAAIGRAMGLGG